jgi:hypothetical protein
MKYKYMTPKNSPFMAELRKMREADSIEFHKDPIGFLKKVRTEAQEFCDELGLKMEVMD